MVESFKLAWRALVRGHVLTLLLVACVLAHLFLPGLVRSDGTAAGWREMYIRAVPTFVYVFTAVTVLGCACGFFANERTRVRLALTVVRPVSTFAVACGKWLALAAVGALVLLATCLFTLWKLPAPPDCQHHYAPTLPAPVECARLALADFLANTNTPQAVREAPRSAVLTLLTNKELDRYDVVPPGGTAAWPFANVQAAGADCSVRVRFATQYELRSPMQGIFTFGDARASVSNNTQHVLDIPLGVQGTVPAAGVSSVTNVVAGRLYFTNTGKETVMLRPRRDLEILSPADAFAANLVRAYLQMFAALALLAAFGLFLSSAVSRPVALFTAFVALLVTLMAPSVVAQFPDEMNTTFTEKLGLVISRTVCVLTGALSEASPISDLATDTCIEWKSVLKSLLVNGLVLPLIFLTATSILVRRKPLQDA